MTVRAYRTAAALASTRLLRAACLALLLAAMALAGSAGPTLAWDSGAYSAGDEQLLFTLTNEDRASAGLNALASDSYLHKEAEWRSKDMADRNYFSHKIPPDDKLVFSYMSQDGYCFKVAGENIGLSTYSDAEATTRIEKAFMGSTSHRANILGDLDEDGRRRLQGRRRTQAVHGPVLDPVRRHAPLRQADCQADGQVDAPGRQPSRRRCRRPTATPEPTAPADSHARSSSTRRPHPLRPPSRPPSRAGRRAVSRSACASARSRRAEPDQGPLEGLFRCCSGASCS